MSFLTATNTELIYNMPAAGADLATSATATIITGNTTSNPPAYLPPLYSIWQPSTIVGKGFCIRLSGTYDTGGTPALTFRYGLNTVQTTIPIATPLAVSGALVTAAVPVTTTGIWSAQIDLTCTGTGTGTNTNFYVDGLITLGIAGGTAAGVIAPLASAANTVPTVVSLVPTQAYWWEASFLWSTSPTHSACQKHMIFGLN
jgi:hypothetical protein